MQARDVDVAALGRQDRVACRRAGAGPASHGGALVAAHTTRRRASLRAIVTRWLARLHRDPEPSDVDVLVERYLTGERYHPRGGGDGQ